MFMTSYAESPLVGVAADELFPNIKGDAFNGDVSFLAAMRVLLHERLPEGASANVVLAQVSDEDLESAPHGDDFVPAVFGSRYDASRENTIYVANISVKNVRGDREQMKAAMADTRAKFLGDVKVLCGAQEDPVVRDGFFDKITVSSVYIDAARSVAFLFFCGFMTNGIWHAAGSMIPRYFKRYFPSDGRPGFLSPWERENIISALSAEKTKNKFESAVYEYSKKFDFRTPAIRAGLRGFEGRSIRSRLKALDKRLEGILSNLQSINEEYARYTRERRKVDEDRAAIMTQLSEDTSNPLMDYFLANQNLHLKEVEDGYIKFYAKAPLRNFNSDLMESILKNSRRGDRADLYVDGPKSVTRKDRDLLYRAIFIDQTITVWLYSEFTLYDGDESRVKASRNFDQPVEMHDCCPNPHQYVHSCMGQNERYANEAIIAGDFILAMQQTVGAVSSVNLNEGITVRPWTNHLLSDTYGRFFETEDGRRMNFTEVMTYLKEGKK